MEILDYESMRVKRTPFGKIDVYTSYGYEFVLTNRVFEMAEVYARKNNWSEERIKTIGGTAPF